MYVYVKLLLFGVNCIWNINQIPVAAGFSYTQINLDQPFAIVVQVTE